VVTVWDARLAARSALAAGIMLGLIGLVGAATDEGVSWLVRLGRTLPLAPAAGAVGAYLALGSARARGEIVALAALGRRPSTSALPAAVGGAFVSLLAAAAVLTPGVDPHVFFPSVPHLTAFAFEGGAFVDHAEGLRVGPTGDIEALAPEVVAATAGLPAHARGAAALATALVGGALALVGARARLGALAPSLAGGLVASAAVLVTFQAAGAALVSVWLAPALAGALLVAAGLGYRARDGA